MQDVSLGAREEILEQVTPEVVEVAVRRMDCGSFRPGRWGLGGDLAPPGRPVFPVQIWPGRLARWPLTAMGPGSTARNFS